MFGENFFDILLRIENISYDESRFCVFKVINKVLFCFVTLDHEVLDARKVRTYVRVQAFYVLDACYYVEALKMMILEEIFDCQFIH
jgi:hypothetical protein